jgi:hypothetical protein
MAGADRDSVPFPGRVAALCGVGAIGFTGVVSWAPGPVSVFLFTALYLTPMLFNMIFHAATSYLYGSYSPGLLTAVVLFPALSWYLISAFAQAGLLRAEAAAAAAVIGAVVHGIDHGAATGIGFSAYVEKKLGRRISLGPGYAQLDRPGLYSDRFNVGKRIFWNGHVALGPEWSLMTLVTYAIDAPVSSASRRRFDLVLSYDLLHRLRAARLL